MKDTKLVIPKSDLEIILAKFYRLKDVSLEQFYTDNVTEEPISVIITANYPKKRRKK